MYRLYLIELIIYKIIRIYITIKKVVFSGWEIHISRLAALVS